MKSRKPSPLPISRRTMLKGGAAVAAGALFSAAGGPALAQQRPPIIDMHMHAWLRNITNVPVPCMGFPCVSRPPTYNGREEVFRGTLAEMDRHNIVLGFLSGTPESVDQWMRMAPGRFLPTPWVPFELGSSRLPDIESLRRDYRSGRFRGMGEITTQYSGLAPNDPRIEPYFALAEELDVPLHIHTAGVGDPTVPTFRSALGHPLLLEDVVVRHPKLRLYFENAGYPYTDESIALMTQYPQVHADLSTITWLIPKTAFDRHVRALVEAGLGKQLMFGSDQMEWPEVIGRGIERIEQATYMTAEQKRDIFYNNAARFLRLDANGKLPQ
jgi:predicted TIM-barrel fold metal-dependent hydrolase